MKQLEEFLSQKPKQLEDITRRQELTETDGNRSSKGRNRNSKGRKNKETKTVTIKRVK